MSTVHVTLIDAASGTPLGEADFPVEQLPETFAAPTTLHLAGGDWRVESAVPLTRAEFAGRALRLVLRKVVTMSPKDILFSLPTLENIPPPLEAPAVGAVRIHEDDWRQCELIAASFEAAADADLAAVREIHAAHRTSSGYRNLHVRKAVPAPLAGVHFAVADLALSGARHALSLGPSGGPPGGVIGGFAFTHGERLIYGREEAGHVVALCIALAHSARISLATAAEPLAALAHARSLVLVDWVRASLLHSNGHTFS